MKSKRSISISIRIFVGIGAVLATFLGPRMAAAQTQASGALQINPSAGQVPPSDVLHSNQSITIQIAVQNTSQVNGNAADAHIFGTTDIFLSCSDSGCSVGVSEIGALAF